MVPGAMELAYFRFSLGAAIRCSIAPKTVVKFPLQKKLLKGALLSIDFATRRESSDRPLDTGLVKTLNWRYFCKTKRIYLTTRSGLEPAQLR